MKIAELRSAHAKAADELVTLATDGGEAYEKKKAEVIDLAGKIQRAQEAQELAAKSAQPVAGQDVPAKAPATAENDRYVKEKSLVVGGVVKMLGLGNGSVYGARTAAADVYGESHPVTKALAVGTGASGGFIVPPDYMNEIIELLRPQAQVRSSNPRNIPMPRGTMTIPGQSAAATASYGSENKTISASQPTLNQITATYKKLTALVPVSNDMMRYADPAVDAFVRDDLVKVIALREDLAFLLGDGTQDAPRGFLSFANGYAAQNGGTAGAYSTSGNSTAASGGNFITSTSSYTLATVAAELGGLVNKLDTANVPERRRVWFMHPRSKNYLMNVQNSLGVYVYRDEVLRGTLFGYPIRTTTQIPVNYKNADSSQSDCSFVFLVEMDEAMIFDSMSLELAVSREGSYVGADGSTYSAFQNDQTLIRAITEHDFQVRHDAAVAVAQFVRWAPAIS